MISTRLTKGHFRSEWLFCWLWCGVNIFEKTQLPVGRPDLNRRPLDPQSRSGRRWTSPGVAQWGLDQA
jgi:hypothetical protein